MACKRREPEDKKAELRIIAQEEKIKRGRNRRRWERTQNDYGRH
jgi:hypothetical protein